MPAGLQYRRRAVWPCFGNALVRRNTPKCDLPHPALPHPEVSFFTAVGEVEPGSPFAIEMVLVAPWASNHQAFDCIEEHRS